MYPLNSHSISNYSILGGGPPVPCAQESECESFVLRLEVLLQVNLSTHSNIIYLDMALMSSVRG